MSESVLLPDGRPSDYLIASVTRSLTPTSHFPFLVRWEVAKYEGRALTLRFITNRSLSYDEEFDTLSVAVAEITADYREIDVDYEWCLAN